MSLLSFRAFFEAGCDATELLELAEAAFHEMAPTNISMPSDDQAGFKHFAKDDDERSEHLDGVLCTFSAHRLLRG